MGLFRKKDKKSDQHTFLYCNCGTELISSDGFVKDNNGYVTYKCPKCDNITTYDFIHYPAPIKVDLNEPKRYRLHLDLEVDYESYSATDTSESIRSGVATSLSDSGYVVNKCEQIKYDYKNLFNKEI